MIASASIAGGAVLDDYFPASSRGGKSVVAFAPKIRIASVLAK